MTGGRASEVFLKDPLCGVLPCTGEACSSCILRILVDTGLWVGEGVGHRWIQQDWSRIQLRLRRLYGLGRVQKV